MIMPYNEISATLGSATTAPSNSHSLNIGISPGRLDELLAREHDATTSKRALTIRALNGDFVSPFCSLPPQIVTLTDNGLVWRGQRFHLPSQPTTCNAMSTSDSTK